MVFRAQKSEFPSVKVKHNLIPQRTYQTYIISDIMSEKTDILILILRTKQKNELDKLN